MFEPLIDVCLAIGITSPEIESLLDLPLVEDPEIRALGGILRTLGQSFERLADDLDSAGELAGERLRRYRRSHRLELGDALIAASAMQYGERLATLNRRHYPGISRLSSPDR